MITNDSFGKDLSTWLQEEGEHRVPDHLAEVLVRTASTRQRPWWSSPERWLPVQATLRLAPSPRLAWLLLIVALIIALSAAFLIVSGSRLALPAPYGPARNGQLVIGMDGDIDRMDPVTHQRTPFISGETWDFGLGFSRDGSRFSFARLASAPAAAAGDPALAIVVADADGSNVRALTGQIQGNCWADWSPDGRRIVYSSKRPDGYGLLNIVDVATGVSTSLDPGVSVGCSLIAWRPPDGNEIVFRGDGPGQHGVFAIRPDGTGFRQVNICDCDTGSVSPDGQTLTVTRWGELGPRIWFLDLSTGAEQMLPIPLSTMARGGLFSPDGRTLAYPLLRAIGPQQNAYQVAIAPVDGHDAVGMLGPTMTLPANGSDEAPVGLAFVPDGSALLVTYGDDPSTTTATAWWLPVDGSPGVKLGHGAFAAIDMQRRAP